MAWCSLSCLSMSGAPGCRGLSSGAWHQVRFHGTDVDKQRPSRCNELLCLHGGAHVEPSCLCYQCVKIGTISWIGCVLLVVQLVILQGNLVAAMKRHLPLAFVLRLHAKSGGPRPLQE